MGREVFVDAGGWIGIGDVDDQYHRAAMETYGELLRQARTLVTTNLVVAEAYIAIRRAAGHRTAIRFLDALEQSVRVVRVYSDATLERDAAEILRRYADQEFSLVDAVSFAVMRRRAIQEAFAFDHHFLTAGFVLLPASA